MSDQGLARVEQQLQRARRRLWAQVVAQSLITSWGLTLLATTIWFLARPFTFVSLGETVRWTVPAVMLGIGTAGGMLLAWIRRPSRLASALALDEKFDLKERVTTLLSLSPAQAESPAGKALRHDVHDRLTALDVTSRFPLRIFGQHLWMSAGAFLLAVTACLLDPVLSNLAPGNRTNAVQARQAVEAKEIQQQIDNLKKVVNERNQEQLPKSEKLQELEKEFEKLINQPVDAKDEEKLRDQINELNKLKDKMNDRREGLIEKAEKIEVLKQQLEKLVLDKDAKLKEGPAKDFEDALMKGEFNQAQKVLEKLAKDLKDDKLSKEKRKELADQFKQLQEKLGRLLDNDELMKQLKEDLKAGKLSPEMQRELDNFKDLKNLADVVNDWRDTLEEKGSKESADDLKKLDELLDRFRQAELSEEEIRDLLRDQQEIDEATRIMMSALAREREGDPDGDGNGQGDLPGGRRKANPNDPDAKIRNAREKAENNPKGMQRVTGYARGGNFDKIPAKSLEGAFRQAAQDAPETLERQRIPRDAAAITGGYFKKLENPR